jgi:uncharacterized membrane protein YccC
MAEQAVRMLCIGSVDVWFLRVMHIDHGLWLALLSVLVLQPRDVYAMRQGGCAMRHVAQRIGGTVAGCLLALVLAGTVPGPIGKMAVIGILFVMALLSYAVDYGLYCLLLSSSFVLMALEGAHAFQRAGVRIELALAMSVACLVTMRVVWPEDSWRTLEQLLGEAVEEHVVYLRATVLFWTLPYRMRSGEAQQMLAPARRNCDLASEAAETAVERMMRILHFSALEFVDSTDQRQAMTFTIALRQLSDTVASLAEMERSCFADVDRLERAAVRLDRLSCSLSAGGRINCPAPPRTQGHLALVHAAEAHIQQLERQLDTLERAAVALWHRTV